MQYNLQNFLLTDLKIGGKSDFKKPSSWPDIRKNLTPNSIRLLADTRYPIGFITTVTGGYSINIDGEHYGDYNSTAQFSMSDWSDYTDTDGYDITYPEDATKAHIIDIYPQTSGENITAFHCSRVAESGTEEQGVLWAHFNISNTINLSKGFAYTEYYNDLLMSVTAKNNLLIPNGLDYCFYNTPSLEYLPEIDYSNVSDLTNFITNATALKNIFLDVAASTSLTKIGIYGDSSHFLTDFKGLRVSNEAPFNNATAPQINISYTNMDKTALTTLFKDLPYNVGYEIIGNPTIEDGVLVDTDGYNNLLQVSGLSLGDNWEIVLNYDTNTSTWHSTATFLRNMTIGGSYTDFSLGTNGTYFYIWLKNTNGDDLSSRIDVMQAPIVNCLTRLKAYENDGTYTLDIYYSTNNGNTWTLSKTITSSYPFYPSGKSIILYLMCPYDGETLNLNNTYIKINGIYLFRGQPAMSKTLSCVGCTGTADLTQDDKTIATGKGWTITLY